jgi:GNAT superfamily N-acetyltransferase
VTFTVRRLLPDDEAAFTRFTAAEDRFELGPDEHPSSPLSPAGARAFLGDPSVLFWLAEAGDEPIGMLFCYVQRRRTAGPWAELLLYEIGTDIRWRRRGVGRALIAAMESWMRECDVADVWVPSSSEAVEFYAACGFTTDDGVIMLKQVAGVPR